MRNVRACADEQGARVQGRWEGRADLVPQGWEIHRSLQVKEKLNFK